MSNSEVATRSCGDVLRRTSPGGFAGSPGQDQAAIANALNWFVVEAPDICADHCVGLVNPPVPDVLLGLPEITVETALRPATFRKHVHRLRYVIEVSKRPEAEAINSLPNADRLRVLGDHGKGESSVSINQRLLGGLLDDFVYARSWLSTYGTNAGYWSYQWICLCLNVSAVDSEASRESLAAKLLAAADHQCALLSSESP